MKLEAGDAYTLGYVYVPAFLTISIASVIAAPYGVRCSQKLPEAYLKKIFAVISLLLSIKMLATTDRAELVRRAEAAKQLQKTGATEIIVAACEELVK